MKDDAKFYFPRYLNEPFRVVVLTLDELALGGVPILTGLLCHFLLTALLVAIIGVLSWRKIKGQMQGYHFLAVLVYWYLPVFTHFRAFAPSRAREYIG